MRASTSASASISRARQVSARLPSKPLELAIGLPALRLGFGVDQIGETFDGGEIEPAVLEGAPGELARLRRPQALDASERAEHRCNHRAAAVQLQLGHVLAGLAVRPGKPQRQRFVDRLAGGGIAHAGQPGLARLRHAAGEGLQRIAGARSGNPHHRDRGRRPTGRESEDRVADRIGHRRHGSAAGKVWSSALLHRTAATQCLDNEAMRSGDAPVS